MTITRVDNAAIARAREIVGMRQVDKRNSEDFASQWNVTEMVNPDGSVTIKRTLRNSDGSQSTEVEEYSSEKSVPITPIKKSNERPVPTVDELDEIMDVLDQTSRKYTNRSVSPDNDESQDPPSIKPVGQPSAYHQAKLISPSNEKITPSQLVNQSDGKTQKNWIRYNPSDEFVVNTIDSTASNSSFEPAYSVSKTEMEARFIKGDYDEMDDFMHNPTNKISSTISEDDNVQSPLGKKRTNLNRINPVLSNSTSVDEISVTIEADGGQKNQNNSFDELWNEETCHNDTTSMEKSDSKDEPSNLTTTSSPCSWNEEKQHRLVAFNTPVARVMGSPQSNSERSRDYDFVGRFNSPKYESPDDPKLEHYDSENSEGSDIGTKRTGQRLPILTRPVEVERNREDEMLTPVLGSSRKARKEKLKHISRQASSNRGEEKLKRPQGLDSNLDITSERSSPVQFTSAPNSAFRAGFQSPVRLDASIHTNDSNSRISNERGSFSGSYTEDTDSRMSNERGSLSGSYTVDTDSRASTGRESTGKSHSTPNLSPSRSSDRMTKSEASWPVNAPHVDHRHFRNFTKEYRVTVVKKSSTDKLGIHVGVRSTNEGNRLVITKLSPTGLVAETEIEVGDIVSSINGFNFLTNPDCGGAQDIVRNAIDRITFVLYKPESGDWMESSSMASFPHERVSEMVNPDNSKTVTKETWGEDGSVVITKEKVDEDGSLKGRTIRRKVMDPDGTMSVFTDDESLGETSSVVVSNEVINISGSMKITVTKRSRSEKVGLTLLPRKTTQGSALAVTKIDKFGLFAKTPLRVGDVILSINNYSCHDHQDAAFANSLLHDTVDDLTIVARKSEESLQAFLRKRGRVSSSKDSKSSDKNQNVPRETHTIEPEMLSDGTSTPMSVTVTKSSPLDRVGISMITRKGENGTNLIVSKISPSSLLTNSSLKPGDIVVAINGISFRENPDTDHAAAVINNASDVITIDYLRSSEPLAAASAANGGQNTRVTHTTTPDGQKVVRTETVNSDGRRTVTIEEFCPPQGVFPIQRSNSDVSGAASLDVSEITWWDAASFDGSFNRRGGAAAAAFALPERDIESEGASGRKLTDSESDIGTRSGHIITPVVVAKGPNVIKVTAVKRNPSQEIGISMEEVNGTLCVTKISPTGLFAGKPILPGDQIHSINGVSLREYPRVRDAYALLDEQATLEIEVLKTTNRNFGETDDEYDEWEVRRRKWSRKNLFGKRRKKVRKNGRPSSTSWLGGGGSGGGRSATTATTNSTANSHLSFSQSKRQPGSRTSETNTQDLDPIFRV